MCTDYTSLDRHFADAFWSHVWYAFSLHTWQEKKFLTKAEPLLYKNVQRTLNILGRFFFFFFFFQKTQKRAV